MTDPSAIADRFGLGPIDQVSYAVRDMDEAVGRFSALFGPFVVRPATLTGIRYRGRTAGAELLLGFGRSGPLEIELVQVLSGDFPQAEYLARHGEGLHHVRFDVQDIETKLAAMLAAGFTEAVWGENPGVRFAYLEAPFLGDGMVELLQRSAS